MTKKGFFSDIDWILVLFLTGVIIIIDMLLAWINISITGGLLVTILVTGLKIAIGFSLYKLISKKKK